MDLTAPKGSLCEQVPTNGQNQAALEHATALLCIKTAPPPKKAAEPSCAREGLAQLQRAYSSLLIHENMERI